MDAFINLKETLMKLFPAPDLRREAKSVYIRRRL